jgi:hypothetical protein
VPVEAIGTVVDLRDAPIDKRHRLGGQAVLLDIAIDLTEPLGAMRSDLVIGESFGHVALL